MNLTYKSCKVYIHISDNVIWYEEGVLYCPLHKYFDETVQKCSFQGLSVYFCFNRGKKNYQDYVYVSAKYVLSDCGKKTAQTDR